MRIGTFTIMVFSLLFCLAALNAAWLSRLIRSNRRKIFFLAYAVLTLFAAATFAGIRFANEYEWISSISGIFYFGSFWTMLQLLLLLAWPISKLAATMQKKLGERSFFKRTPASGSVISRRSFITQAAVLPPAAMTGINAVGLLDAELGIVLRRMDMAYGDLPAKLHGLKVAHMTDVHIGPYVSVTNLEKMFEMLRKEAPDLLAITGDFVDDLSKLPVVARILRDHVAEYPLGVWFCMGNHEYIRGAAPIRKMLQDSGVKILDNQNKELTYKGCTFYVAGVDYPMAARIKTQPEDVERNISMACMGMEPDHFSILLSHHPDFLPAAFVRNIRLTLAGHTHGAQIGWVGGRSALDFAYPYMRGIYHGHGNMGFVSSGAGHWLPFRLNCPPELTVFTITGTKLA